MELSPWESGKKLEIETPQFTLYPIQKPTSYQMSHGTHLNLGFPQSAMIELCTMLLIMKDLN